MIKELCLCDEEFGNKAYWLAKACRLGLPTPKGFCVKSPTREEINLIKSYFKSRGIDLVNIRSSSVSEDSFISSQAGRFKSYIAIPVEELQVYLEKVLKDAKSAIVSEYISSKLGGFGFTLWEGFLVEVSKDPRDVTSSITKARFLYKQNDFERGYIDLSLFSREVEDVVMEVINYLNELKKELGIEVDVEWLLREKPYILQLRPVTRKLELKSIFEENVVVSRGKCKGKVIYIESEKDIEEKLSKINEKVIVVVEHLYYALSRHFDKICGIVCRNASLLSHLSILCRENEIPCVGSKTLYE